MKTLWSTLIAFGVLGISFIGAGCGNAGSQKLDEGYMQNAEALGKQRREIFLRTNGEYDKMSAADREQFLKTFDGKEENAKRYWEGMQAAGPPGAGGARPPAGAGAGTGGG